MSTPLPFGPDVTIASLLEAFPQATALFLKYRMACIGCSMARFDTLQDAVFNYQLDFTVWMDELRHLLAISPRASREG